MRQWLLAIALLHFGAPLVRAQTPGLTINKQPVVFAQRTFDPARPPADMPPFTRGEKAECDSDFLSDAGVGGQARQTDATHLTVTISQIKVTLQLNITTWLPTKVTQHVIDHEAGHRQISEYYYQTADKLYERIVTPYMGKQVVISGPDLHGEMSKLLQKMSTDITNEFHKEMTPELAQDRFDALTDHGLNAVVAANAVAQALKEMAPAGTSPGAELAATETHSLPATSSVLSPATSAISTDLSGVWLAYYPGGPLRVSVRQTGKDVVATLLTGNVFVPAGQITFYGTFGASPFVAKQICAGQNFASPHWIGASIRVVDSDHLTEDADQPGECSGFPVLWKRLKADAAEAQPGGKRGKIGKQLKDMFKVPIR